MGFEVGLGPGPVPEPPHVAVLVGEEAVRVVAAVLVVAEAAAEDGGRLAPRPRAAEAAHHLLLGAHVARAGAAHRARAGPAAPSGHQTAGEGAHGRPGEPATTEADPRPGKTQRDRQAEIDRETHTGPRTSRREARRRSG